MDFIFQFGFCGLYLERYSLLFGFFFKCIDWFEKI